MRNTLWVDDLFAGLMVAVAAYSVARLIAARAWSRPTHRDVDVAHVLMGTSMAGQLVSDLNPFPNGLWELVFVGLSGWFAWRCYQFVRDPGTDSRYDDHVHRLSRRVIHLMMALAMLYMYLAAVPAEIGTGMAMGTPTGAAADFVFIPTVFVVAFLASAVWQVDAIGRFARTTDMVHLVTEGGATEASLAPVPGADRSGTSVSVAERTVPVAGTSRPPWLAPRLEAGAHIAMAVTMAYMLVLML